MTDCFPICFNLVHYDDLTDRLAVHQSTLSLVFGAQTAFGAALARSKVLRLLELAGPGLQIWYSLVKT